MSRLPNILEPLFPAVKRVHVATTRCVGAATRIHAERHPSETTVPWRGTDRVEETARLEPDSVTLHVTAPGYRVRRPAPSGEPEQHPFFAPLTTYDVPHRYVLEITQGRVVGDMGAVISPGGILDYETSEYFGVSTWREHPVYLRPRIREPEHVGGTLLSLATRGTRANYYHFLMDLLPRWGLYEEFRSHRPGPEPDAVVLHAATRYQREILRLAGLDRLTTIQPSRNSALSADRLIAPGQPNRGTLAPPWTTSWLREALPPGSTRGLPRRIYVTRGDRRHTRRVVNEAQILPILRSHGFVVINPGAMTVQEQINHFAAADAVVGPHGAALTNLNFSAAGVRVLELFSPTYLNSCYWAITSNVPGSRYRYLIGNPRAPGSTAWGTLGVQNDITVDPASFEAAVGETLNG